MALRLNATACALGAKAGATVVGVASLTALGLTLTGGSSHAPVSKVVAGSVVVSTDWPVPPSPTWSPDLSTAKGSKTGAHAAKTTSAQGAHKAPAHQRATAGQPPVQPSPNAALVAAVEQPSTSPPAPTKSPNPDAAPTAWPAWWHGGWSGRPSPSPSPTPSPSCTPQPGPGDAAGQPDAQTDPQVDATIDHRHGCDGPGDGGPGHDGPGHGGPRQGDPGHGGHHGPGGRP